MNIIESIQHAFDTFLTQTFNTNAAIAKECMLSINADELKQQFGDLNSSAALILSKQLKKSPRIIAQEIADHFHHTHIEKIEIAGPGFLNLFFTADACALLAQEMFHQKDTFFKPCALKSQKINIEFVSPNPTGPLHFGHGRGGIIGDVLSNVLLI